MNKYRITLIMNGKQIVIEREDKKNIETVITEICNKGWIVGVPNSGEMTAFNLAHVERFSVEAAI